VGLQTELETTMQKDLPAFLQLYHSFTPSRNQLLQLLERFDGNPRRILSSSPGELRARGLDSKTIARIHLSQRHRVDSDLAWARRAGNHLICYRDASYPELLRQITDPPALLYASGDLKLLQSPQIAIVGSRNCTPGGMQNAIDFATQCAAAGLVITSGLALGIDAAAHRGALDAGGGTIAVMGTGLDKLYPQRNRKLAQEIIENGLLISEFPFGTAARPANFPQRNRIISGLAIATLVVEAAQRSGSLITARLAAEQGREVFAIPGSIHNPQARGCHQLIRDGATLIETAEDIGVELGNLFEFALRQQITAPEKHSIALDAEQRALLDSIGYDPVHCDLLAHRSGLTIDKLSSMLVELELNDLIQTAPGGRYVRI
jgi:DNA processing protein